MALATRTVAFHTVSIHRLFAKVHSLLLLHAHLSWLNSVSSLPIGHNLSLAHFLINFVCELVESLLYVLSCQSTSLYEVKTLLKCKVVPLIKSDCPSKLKP